MIRLRKLIVKHGIEANIWDFNRHYGIDLLRCTAEEFQAILDHITITDVLRFRMELDSRE